MIKMLVGEGLQEIDVKEIFDRVWTEGNVRNFDELKKIGEFEILFKILKKNNVRIVFIILDNRKGIDELLDEFKLIEYFEYVICGDDLDFEFKLFFYNVLKICKKLGVDLVDIVMVGDIKIDMLLGKFVKLGWSVGVLSGVGQIGDLFFYVDYIVEDIEDILFIILFFDDWQSFYVYFFNDRFLVKFKDQDYIGVFLVKFFMDLVIFDFYGIFICIYWKYLKFVEFFCFR